MSFELIARFENKNRSFVVQKHKVQWTPPHEGEHPYFVVRDDDAQHGPFWDSDSAISDAAAWAGDGADRIL